MAEVDTSSYPHAAAQANPLDTVAKLQSIQSNQIGIDQNKLKLINDRYQIVNKALGTLLYKPDITAKDVVNTSQDLVKLGLSNPEQHAQFVTGIPTDPNKLKKFL